MSYNIIFFYSATVEASSMKGSSTSAMEAAASAGKMAKTSIIVEPKHISDSSLATLALGKYSLLLFKGLQLVKS